eukprot:4962133-Pyramimonas_sp.AAC.1
MLMIPDTPLSQESLVYFTVVGGHGSWFLGGRARPNREPEPAHVESDPGHARELQKPLSTGKGP